MQDFRIARVLIIFTLTIAVVVGHAQAPTVKGTFVMNKTDAKLAHVRATKTVLDDGKKQSAGYTVLLSERVADGDFSSWRLADAHERGSFIYLMLESTGDVWIAQLAHRARKGGSIGVVMELKKVTLSVKDGRIMGQYRTNREETFFDDRYSIDVTFDAPLEGK
jgi:hypothetical protein